MTTGFELQRLGISTNGAEPGNPHEVEGSLFFFWGRDKRQLCYSAGLMVLAKEHPREILYRSAEPVLTPVLITRTPWNHR